MNENLSEETCEDKTEIPYAVTQMYVTWSDTSDALFQEQAGSQ